MRAMHTARRIAVAACLLAACQQDAVPTTSHGTVQFALQQFTDTGDPGVAWELLPASYQRDLARWAHELAAVLPPSTYDGAFVVLRKAGVVAKTKNEFLVAFGPLQFARRFFGNAGEDDLLAVLTAIGNTLILLGKSELATTERLAQLEPGAFLHGTGARIYQQVRRAYRVTGREPDHALRGWTVSPAHEDGDQARVRLTRDGREPFDLALLRVEGRWLPRDLVDAWAQAKQGVETFLERAREGGLDVGTKRVDELLARLTADLDTLAATDSRTRFGRELEGMVVRYKQLWQELR